MSHGCRSNGTPDGAASTRACSPLAASPPATRCACCPPPSPPIAKSRGAPRVARGATSIGGHGGPAARPPMPVSQMTRTADVVIVGAGTTGLSIAFHLAMAGTRHVVVLERRFIGAGGTGRSVGIIRQLYPTRETTAMVVRSLAVYRDFDAVVGGASGYVGCGALIGVAPEMRSSLEQTISVQRSLGVRAELLAPSDV